MGDHGRRLLGKITEVRLVRTVLGPCVWLSGGWSLSRVLLIRPLGVADIMDALTRVRHRPIGVAARGLEGESAIVRAITPATFGPNGGHSICR